MAAVAARRSGRPMLRGCLLLTLPSVARSSRRSPDIGHHQPVEADVIVAGLGAHGSATAYALSKRGASVLGFDRFARGHTLGSSGGRSRIIRTAYYEHSDYVPLLRLAEANGATLRFEEPVESWESTVEGVRVQTQTGQFDAARLVLAAGPWMSTLAKSIATELWVERNVLFWFEPRGDRKEFERLPVYIIQDTDRIFYGFPYIGGQGVKVAGLHFGDHADPDTIDRAASAHDEERVRDWLRRRVPLLDGPPREAKVCMYTNTPDAHFIIDLLVEDTNVVVASACSGHGFKFASVVGEICADLAL